MFSFLKRKEKTPDTARAAAPAAAPAEDETWPRKFVDRPTNANMVALVHLYVASRLLEQLVEREVINFGVGVTKADEAIAIAKGNYAFINTVTQAHSDHASNLDEFRVGIQERVTETAGRLVAIMRTGENRIGRPDAELAAKPPLSLKGHIAVLLTGLDILFGIRNPAAEDCERMIDEGEAVHGDEAHMRFLAGLRESIGRGNATKAYAFVRIAGFSLVSLCGDSQGRASVEARIRAAVKAHGQLDNRLIRFDDMAEVVEEEEYENLEPLFAGETIRFEEHPACFAAMSEALLAWLRGRWKPAGEIVAAVGGGAALFQELDIDPQTGATMGADDLAGFLLRRLKTTLSETGRGAYDCNDKRALTTRIGPLRGEVLRFGNALGGFARAARPTPSGDHGGAPDTLLAQTFAAVAGETLIDATRAGAVTLDDRAIRHTEDRPAGFDEIEGALRALQKQIRADFFAAEGGREEQLAAEALQADFDLADRMLTLFSHAAHAALAEARKKAAG